MRRNVVRKIFKIIGWVFLILIGLFIVLLYYFTKPSTDAAIYEKFEDETHKPRISYVNFKGYQVRIVRMQEKRDSLLPTIFFVHGSPGSSMDFQRYLKDSMLNSKANLMTYDRVGYGPERTGEVLPSLDDEISLLHQIIRNENASTIILVGYSYGGTIVMASELAYKKKMALAASVRGDLEPMFWAMNLYKWKLTRPLIPKVFRGASIEKFRHVEELGHFENRWDLSPSKVLSIHGKQDFIVPFENSLFLKKKLSSSKFSLIPLEEGDHSLIWTNFDLIKNELIKSAVQE
ncbi:alpha/beta fold hydrolase [Lutimonas sp.]|uniref:alpha/beta fold hydrolase n=1 Tax=Lutimonas sp. TaxID=1872403 RepID=UPI003D9B1E0B